ncbi:MAG: TatD family hydrolase [Phycisphaeraceae bacterium]|nr:TatD family hydrolase [Phycisphaeraceae bacterium]
MIDTHCHLSFSVFEGRVAEEVAAMHAAGVKQAISVSTTSADAIRARTISETHPEVFHTAGVHPLYSDQPVNWGDLREVASGPRCVAWGELGLDRHHRKPPLKVQLEVLLEQLDRIARWRSEGLDLPIVIHCRDAFDDLLPVLVQSTLPMERMVFHCFSGSPDEARRVLDLGSMISFTGIVTYANAPLVAEAAALVPLDRLMVETDAPFLSPEPMRGTFPNRPAHVPLVAAKLAALHGLAPEVMSETLDDNARRFFNLPRPAVA